MFHLGFKQEVSIWPSKDKEFSSFKKLFPVLNDDILHVYNFDLLERYLHVRWSNAARVDYSLNLFAVKI